MTNKPGFYVATVRGVEGVRGLLSSDGWFYTAETVVGYLTNSPGNFTDLRPLWTADPESDDWEALAEAYMNSDGNAYNALRGAIRALADPEPPLVEPNGVGAYVHIRLPSGKYTHALRGFDGRWTTTSREVVASLDIYSVESHGVGCTCGGPDCPGGAS